VIVPRVTGLRRPVTGRPSGDRPERPGVPSADARPSGERPGADRGRGRVERAPEERDAGPGSDRDQPERGNGTNGRQQSAGPGNQAANVPVNGQADDSEGGNRRRRRRNRERVDGQVERPEGSTDDSFAGEPVPCAGLLDLRDEGYGFLRVKGYLPHRDDVYVSVRQVRQLGLRKGDHLAGPAGRPTARRRTRRSCASTR
jgi:transcription termination factor Rho